MKKYQRLSTWVNVRAMKGMTGDYLHIIREISLKCGDFRSFTRCLTTYHGPNFRRYNKSFLSPNLASTWTICFDYFIDIFGFYRVDNEITPSRNKMSISHDIDRSLYRLTHTTGMGPENSSFIRWNRSGLSQALTLELVRDRQESFCYLHPALQRRRAYILPMSPRPAY